MARPLALLLLLWPAVAGCGPADERLTVRFVEPADGTFVTGTVPVRIDVEPSDAVAAVELRAGGSQVARLYAPPWEATLDTSLYPDGPLRLEAVAIPTASGSPTSASISIAVDNASPLLILVEPEEGSRWFVEDAPLRVRAVVADGSKVARAEVRVTGTAVAVREIAAPPAELDVEIPWAEIVPTGASAPTAVTVAVTAIDAVNRHMRATRATTVRSRARWFFDTLGRVTRPPLVAADGTIWVGSEVGAVIHLDGAGQELCRYAGSADFPVTSSPAAAGDLVLFGTTHSLRALDASCGVVWTYGVAGTYYATPAWDPARATIYAVSYTGTMHALSAAGAARWTLALGGHVESSPVVDPADGSVYVGVLDDYRLHAVTPEGAERWTFPTGREVYADPVLRDGRLYFGSADGWFYAVDTAGALAWPIGFETAGPIRAPAAVAPDGTIAFGSLDGTLYALAADGSERWRLETAGLDRGGPAIDASGAVYVGDTAGVLHALAPDGTERWRLEAAGAFQASGVIAGGVLYVGSHDRRLYAIDLGAP